MGSEAGDGEGHKLYIVYDHKGRVLTIITARKKAHLISLLNELGILSYKKIRKINLKNIANDTFIAYNKNTEGE